MTKCKHCGREDFKFRTRTNYPFGMKSKGRTTVRKKVCKNCGLTQ